MAMAAVVLGIIFLICIRDNVRVETVEQVKAAGGHAKAERFQSAWTVRRALTSPVFIQIALAMLVIQTVVTTLHSILVAHVATLGHGSAPGAFAMSMLALAGTVSKGVTGALTEKLSPKLLLVGGLALQCLAMVMLGSMTAPITIYLTALLFGAGWGFGWLAAHVLLLRYFGAAIAGEMVAMATMSTTAAVLGPLYAGYVADTQGSFAPVFMVFAVLLGVVTLVAAMLPSERHGAERASGTEPSNDGMASVSPSLAPAE
jgi:MFS family permease